VTRWLNAVSALKRRSRDQSRTDIDDLARMESV